MACPPRRHGGGQVLPEDLIYDIIVDIFAEHLHLSLVAAEPRDWNAFVTVPLVSRFFHALVQPLFHKIFGREAKGAVDPASRRRRFAISKALWAETRLDPCPVWTPAAAGFTADEIPRPYKALGEPSLLAVYDLLARGRFFFDAKAVHAENELSCLTLWCPYLGQAMRMCDAIFPPRILAFLGPFVAAQTTYCYSFECVNGVQNAIENLLRPPTICGIESYVGQNLDSLKGLEENKWHFLWLGGFISNTYRMCITPTPQIIKTTNILDTLQTVVAHDWKHDPYNLRSCADELFKIYSSRIQTQQY